MAGLFVILLSVMWVEAEAPSASVASQDCKFSLKSKDIFVKKVKF